MKELPVQFYGDNVRWFIATVVDARPPKGEKLEGRVCIRIHGTMSPSTADIPQGDLPWAQVLIPTTEGGTSGLGATPRLEAGTNVFGFFMDGKASQTPIVLGSLPQYEFASPVQVGNDPGFIEQALEAVIGFINKDLVEDDNTGAITQETRLARQSETIRYLMDQGYTRDQAIGMAAALDISSGMVTGYSEDETRYGIGGWSATDQERLRNSTELWDTFSGQMEYIVEKAKESNLNRATTISKNTQNNSNTVFASLEALNQFQETNRDLALDAANRINDDMGGG